MMSRTASFHRLTAITPSVRSLGALKRGGLTSGRAVRTFQSTVSGGLGLQTNMWASHSAIAMGGRRAYGGSMYHFSAAEKEESAIISDKDDGDNVAANSEAGTDSGDSVAVNKEDASEGVKELCEQILNLDIVEMNQLLFRLQSRLGISDQMLAGVGSGGGGGGGGAGGDAAPAEEVKVKDSFDVKLTAFDPKAKIKIIKEVRAISGLGLKEAKELVEKAPTVVKDGLSKDEAEKLAAVLTELGGSVELV